MFTRALTALVALRCGLTTAVSPASPTPASFTQGDGSGGPASPARCRIENVQNAHLSSYLRDRQDVDAVKGNAVARCDAPVPYLSLSVSVIDVDRQQVVAKNVRPKEVTNQAYIASLETIVPCINNNITNYQVSALGVSQEGGDYYEQVEFGKISPVPCGHA